MTKFKQPYCGFEFGLFWRFRSFGASGFPDWIPDFESQELHPPAASVFSNSTSAEISSPMIHYSSSSSSSSPTPTIHCNLEIWIFRCMAFRWHPWLRLALWNRRWKICLVSSWLCFCDFAACKYLRRLPALGKRKKIKETNDRHSSYPHRVNHSYWICLRHW